MNRFQQALEFVGCDQGDLGSTSTSDEDYFLICGRALQEPAQALTRRSFGRLNGHASVSTSTTVQGSILVRA